MDPLEHLRNALLACLPSAVRLGDGLRIPEANGSVRVIVPRGAHDPQVDHGIRFGFAPSLEPEISLEACHLRTRCRRSVEGIEAAHALAEGKDPEANATFLAVESVRQITQLWAPFLEPRAWVGPSVEELLRSTANAAPSDVERLLAMLRAAAAAELGTRDVGRDWLKIASQSGDLRVRSATDEVRRRLSDA